MAICCLSPGTLNPVWKAVRYASFGLIAASLSACASLPAANNEPVNAPRVALPAALQTFLEEAPAEGRAVFPHSPWGDSATILAHAPYDAASGRTCRELSIESGGVRQPGLACRLPNGSWQSVRVLHYIGRPLLTQQPGPQPGQGAE